MILVMRMDETIPGTAIKVEPKFVNAANGDFTLSSSELLRIVVEIHVGFRQQNEYNV